MEELLLQLKDTPFLRDGSARTQKGDYNYDPEIVKKFVPLGDDEKINQFRVGLLRKVQIYLKKESHDLDLAKRIILAIEVRWLFQ